MINDLNMLTKIWFDSEIETRKKLHDTSLYFDICSKVYSPLWFIREMKFNFSLCMVYTRNEI